MMARPPHVLIIAGGTGGHILPGLRVGRAIERTSAGAVEARYLCGSRPIERRIYDSQGVAPRMLAINSGAGLLGRAALVGAAARAFAVMTASFLRERPLAVVAFGGAVCAPVLCAAAALRVPIFLHESNAVPGRTTRLFSRLARKTYSGFPLSGIARAEVLGNPGPDPGVATPLPERRTVLCVGGSQGAAALNDAFAGAAELLGAEFPQLEFVLVAGPGRQQPATENLSILEYVEDMAGLLAGTRLAVSRSGSGGLADLAALGVPALLVPFPHAMDDHQRLNAERYAEQGAAVVIPQAVASVERLAAEMRVLLADEAKLAAMAGAAKNRHAAGAAERIAIDVVQTASTANGVLAVGLENSLASGARE